MSAEETRCLQALHSPESARALRTLVLELAREGWDKDQIYDLLSNLVLHLRQGPDGRPGDEEVLLDVLDALSGWCHPDAAILTDNSSPLS